MSICCSFCQHPNPAGAKYCNECGGTLRLKPCDGCDAVNDSHASRCHACGAPLDDVTMVPSLASSPRTAPASSSVLRALETIEADLATLDHGDIVRERAVPDAPRAARSADTRDDGRVARVIEGIGASMRRCATRAKASPVSRPLLFASLMLVATSGIFLNDQQHAPMVSLAGPPALVAAPDAAVVAGRDRGDVREQGAPILQKSSSTRSTLGAIVQASPRQARQDGSDNASTAIPSQAETVSPATGTSASRPGAPVASAPATPERLAQPARAASSGDASSLVLQWHADDERGSASHVSIPMATNDCAQSLAALGLCRVEVDHAH